MNVTTRRSVEGDFRPITEVNALVIRDGVVFICKTGVPDEDLDTDLIICATD